MPFQMNYSNRPAEGILCVDKPKGSTSHDVCAFVRSHFRISKVGHAGTLDPLATGVLVLLLGRATKRSQELSMFDKDYFGSMRLGLQTDTHDAAGKVIGEKDWKFVSEEAVRNAFQKFS